MSYINITATESYVMVNKQLAKILTWQGAAYWAELNNILIHVKSKKAYDEKTGFFTIQRSFIERDLGISAADQKELDRALAKLKVMKIHPENSNKIALDAKRMVDLLVNDDIVPEEVLSVNYKISHEQRQKNKEDKLIDDLVLLFGETDEKLIKMYRFLVEAYFRRGYVTGQQWHPVIEAISEVAKTKEDKIALVDFILGNNWSSIISSINTFKEKHLATGTRLNANTKVCKKTKDGVAF